MTGIVSVHSKARDFNLSTFVGVVAIFCQYYDLNPIEPVTHLAKQYIIKQMGHTDLKNPLSSQLEEEFFLLVLSYNCLQFVRPLEAKSGKSLDKITVSFESLTNYHS